LFPAFSTSSIQDPGRTALLFGRGTKYVFVCLFPICLLIITFATEGLDLWLGREFVRKSTHVLQWLAVGVFLNSLAHIAFAFIQGVGRPDLTAKLHLIELPLYVLLVWHLIGAYGIEGAAIAWALRTGIDAIFLFAIAQRLLPTEISTSMRKALAMVGVLIIFGLGSMQISLLIKAAFIGLVLTAFIFTTWFLVLAPDERAMIGNRIRAAQASTGSKKWQGDERTTP
jgi:O-antigen/teichoic acid export membrane protein